MFRVCYNINGDAMKKILIILLLLLTACQSQLSVEDKTYNDISVKLIETDQFDEVSDFHLSLTYEEVDGGYRYLVILDDPQINMYNITMMCYAGEDKGDILPCLGIYDEDSYHLIPNKVDKINGYYKGITLSGYVKDKIDVKVYVRFYDDIDSTIENELYLKVEK